MKELGIYIHIPFCKQKCYYCDFISYGNKESWVEEYIYALQQEIEQRTGKWKDKNEYIVSTIYIGGGTPSYINEKYIEQILKCIQKNLKVDKKVEITIEVNPGTVTKEKLASYQKNGINRLSIGLQSTQNELLKKIGRIHTEKQFQETYSLARKIGFKNINIDVMIGLPSQKVEEVENTVYKAIALKPEHISIYSLIVEENTVMQSKIESGEYILPNEEDERNMYWKCKNMLEKEGYIHYEISNFAKKGWESKHNQNCWKQYEYLGFGLAAHSYYQGKRYSNIEDIKQYIENIRKKEKIKVIHEIQDKEDQEKEFMLLGLRKIQGISIQEFKMKFHENPIYLFKEQINKLVKERLIEIDLDQIKLTERGIDLANLVWEEFV